ncbi:MAG: DUF1501 domain-containing protein [Planctomycetota bacterium]
MTTFNRRDILRAGGVGAFATAFANASSPVRLLRSSFPSLEVPAITAPRLLTIFLRGAHDGVYTVVPTGDPTYTTARPTLQPATIALPGTTFARLNSAYADLMPIFSAGRAAFLHQVGNPNGGRSHFVEMQVYEGAKTTAPLREDGVIARLRANGAFGTSSGPVFGASVSQRMQQLYRGFVPNELMAHVRGISDYTLGLAPIADRQRASMATHLSQTPTGPIEPFVDAVGEYVAATEAAISGITYTHDPVAFPVNATESTAAMLPNAPIGHTFMSHCEQALQLLKSAVGCQAVGIELGAWDTHNDQAVERVPLDAYLAKGIRSLHDAAVAVGMLNLVILVKTEFGRTNIENGSLGTDHGVGGLMMAFGPRVTGGVYNCYRTSGLGAQWRALGTSPTTHTLFPNACPVATDFRLVYAELFHKLFGIPHGAGSAMGVVIPGWTDTAYLGCFN